MSVDIMQEQPDELTQERHANEDQQGYKNF
jgi:hypothetical protein